MSRISNDTIISENGQSLNSDWISPAINLNFLTNYSIQLNFTGTISGTFYLEASNSLNEENAIWSTITGSSQIINEAGDHTWEVREAGYKMVRVIWQRASGSGTLTSARFNAKGV